MKRIMSILTATIVAVSFATLVSAADTTTTTTTTDSSNPVTGTRAAGPNEPTKAPVGDSVKHKKHHKKKHHKKHKKMVKKQTTTTTTTETAPAPPAQ
ncbi:MAG TPA: hypothetical protein VJ550_00350 [Geomonas sp.]|nr:hypothetical protein [Geomonas sp.]